MNYKYKIMNRSIGYALIILLLFSAGIACSKNSSKITEEGAMVHGKTAAPISISYELASKADIGRETPVTIICKTLSDVDDLKLWITAGKGIDIVQDIEAEYGVQSASFDFSEEVRVIPKQEGILYLNVFVSGTFGNSKMVRSSAVPINVGNIPQNQLKTSGKIKTESTGRKIISMPAGEEND